MALKTKVKVSHVGNLHDARYCAGMGVDMIGIPISKDMEGYVASENFREIVGWLAGVEYVGEVNSVDIASLENYPLNFIETSLPSDLESLKDLEAKLVLRLEDTLGRPGDIDELLATYASKVSFFILELKDFPAADAEASWLTNLSDKYEIYLEAPLDADNVNVLLDLCSPKGLVLKGSEEIKTGINDFDKLAEVLEALDTDEFV